MRIHSGIECLTVGLMVLCHSSMAPAYSSSDIIATHAGGGAAGYNSGDGGADEIFTRGMEQ